MFKAGDIIKLKNYEIYGDHKRHRGETAVVIDPKYKSLYKEFDISIGWKDGVVSFASCDNCLKINKEWDEEENISG